MSDASPVKNTIDRLARNYALYIAMTRKFVTIICSLAISNLSFTELAYIVRMMQILELLKSN